MINKQKQAEAYLTIIEGLRMYWEAQADAARREQFYSRGVKPEPWHGSDEGPTFKKASDQPMDFPSGGEINPPPVGPRIIAEEAGPVDRFALEEVAKRIEERHADTGGGILWDQGPHYADEAQGRVRLARRMAVLSFAEFKELEELPRVCEIWAAKGMAKKIKRYAIGKGYELTAQVPKGSAKILEFTLKDELVGFVHEPEYAEFKASQGLSIDESAEDEAGRLVSMVDLYKMFRNSRKLTDPIDSGHAVDFAKLVRVLTIQETTDGIVARMPCPVLVQDEVITGPPVCYVKERPDENLILLPKDFNI